MAMFLALKSNGIRGKIYKEKEKGKEVERLYTYLFLSGNEIQNSFWGRECEDFYIIYSVRYSLNSLLVQVEKSILSGGFQPRRNTDMDKPWVTRDIR